MLPPPVPIEALSPLTHVAVTAEQAAERFLSAGGATGSFGVVLGTGLGGLVERLEDRFTLPAAETGFLPRSTATGHAGRIVSGRLGDARLVMLQGRIHLYEGFGVAMLGRGMKLLAALGVGRVLLTNAAGGLDPAMRPGDIVVLDDHLDWARSSGEPGGQSPGPRSARTMSPGRVYDPALVDRAVMAVARRGFRCRGGVYVYVSGPTYETRAEYRMFRRLGGDVVGMSTVPEAVQAWQLGMEVAAASVVTNVARPDAPSVTDAEDVCQAAATAADGIWAMLEALAIHTPTPPPGASHVVPAAGRR